MLTKTQLKDLAKKHNFYLRKNLGQNFLIDKNKKDKIIRLLDLNKDDIVLEIGPGLGALTEDIAKRCRYVYAVEKDRKLCSLLKEILSGYKNLEVINCDFLKFDIEKLPHKTIKVVGALPYYITTPIIEHIFKFKKRIDAIFITVQNEVAKRMNSRPGEDDNSSFSLFVQFHSDVKLLMNLKRNLFFPEPEVDSTLVRLKILSKPRIEVKNEDMLFKVIRSSFSQRRKTLLSALSHKGILGLNREDIVALLNSLNIDKKRRAETLSLEEFANIANTIVHTTSG